MSKTAGKTKYSKGKEAHNQQQQGHQHQTGSTKKVFDVVRPGKAPASPTSRPVLASDRPPVADDQFIMQPKTDNVESVNSAELMTAPPLRASDPLRKHDLLSGKHRKSLRPAAASTTESNASAASAVDAKSSAALNAAETGAPELSSPSAASTTQTSSTPQTPPGAVRVSDPVPADAAIAPSAPIWEAKEEPTPAHLALEQVVDADEVIEAGAEKDAEARRPQAASAAGIDNGSAESGARNGAESSAGPTGPSAEATPSASTVSISPNGEMRSGSAAGVPSSGTSTSVSGASNVPAPPGLGGSASAGATEPSGAVGAPGGVGRPKTIDELLAETGAPQLEPEPSPGLIVSHHKSHTGSVGSMGAGKALLLFLLIILAAAITLNFLLDANIIQTGWHLPHTEWIE